MTNKSNCTLCQTSQETGCEFILEESGECTDTFEDKTCKASKTVKELTLTEILTGDDEDLYSGDPTEDLITQLLTETVISESSKELICEASVGSIVWEVKASCTCPGTDTNIDYISEEAGKQPDAICEWTCQTEVKVPCKSCYLL